MCHNRPNFTRLSLSYLGLNFNETSLRGLRSDKVYSCQSCSFRKKHLTDISRHCSDCLNISMFSNCSDLCYSDFSKSSIFFNYSDYINESWIFANLNIFMKGFEINIKPSCDENTISAPIKYHSWLGSTPTLFCSFFSKKHHFWTRKPDHNARLELLFLIECRRSIGRVTICSVLPTKWVLSA